MKRSLLKRAFSAVSKNLGQKILSKTFDLALLEGLKEGAGFRSRGILPSDRIQGGKPHFLGGNDSCDLSGYDGAQFSPEVQLCEFENVCVMGRTEFILKDDKAYYPKVLDPAVYAFMIEIEGRGRVHPDHRKITLFPRSRSQTVDRAISLLGQCSGNYAHWLTEVLARLVLIEDREDLRDFPLLVDYPVHKKLIHALEVMNKNQRKIIPVRNYEKVYVKSLVYVTLPAVTPAETRHFFNTATLDTPRSEQFQFSSEALRRVRKTALERAALFAVPPQATPKTAANMIGRNATMGGTSPRLAYLNRTRGSTGNGRHILNDSGVEDMLKDHGFTSIDVFSLPFETVIQTFQNLEVVVAPIGAAIANLTFCPPGLKVIVLTPFYEMASFHYFANLLAALGHEAIFVLGPQAKLDRGSVYNRNYFIPLPELESALSLAYSNEIQQIKAKS